MSVSHTPQASLDFANKQAARIEKLCDVLEDCRPLLKRLAVEGSEEAERVLGEIEEVLLK